MSQYRYFITGTDTDVGKTSISCALLHLARKQGLTTAAGKPIASGSDTTPQGLRNSDALLLQAECQPALDYTAINPFSFSPAIAPHIAAKEAGIALTLDNVTSPMRTLLEHQADFTLIEGAGGWRVPINGQHTLADVAMTLELDVIMVVGVKLGALNHARLTLEAIEHDGLKVAGWVGNIADPYTGAHATSTRLQENLNSLSHCLPVPCLGIVPHLQSPTASAIAPYIDFPRLGASS